MIRLSPWFYSKFNFYLPLKTQVEILNTAFEESRSVWLENQKVLQESGLIREVTAFTENELSVQGTELNKSFYDKKWRWCGFVPSFYRRTSCPRISAYGGTLHGIKKDMSKRVLKMAVQEIPNACFIDIDFSACHAHIAASLLAPARRNSALFEAITVSNHFWDRQAAFYADQLKQHDLELSPDILRSILKVSFYTALNRGNFLSPVRFAETFCNHAPSIACNFKSIAEFNSSLLAQTLIKLLKDMPLLKDIRQLAWSCVDPSIYTVDRIRLYSVTYPHQGISRVLQGVEVVRTGVLLQHILRRGGLPLNLAHDGALVMFLDCAKPSEICPHLTYDVNDWSNYLLNGLSIPLEAKYLIEIER